MSSENKSDTVLSAIMTRRSIRKFTGAAVPRGALEQIVAAGVEAPSGCNMQSRQYIIVDDAAVLDQIRPCSTALASAPAAIVLLTDAKSTPYGEFWVQDAAAAMENMLLAAHALGYGAVWIEGALRRSEDLLRTALAVPPELRIWSMLPVGTPAETPPRPPKPAAGEVTHYNRFGGR
ncbi:MAG: nitroreductase family protein [Planctomycetaceae bacterium]|nr:nitroreductase family protein [Planctomycetaceae bacterium]